jgi:hypothetical protein
LDPWNFDPSPRRTPLHAPVLLYLYIRIRDALINFDVLMTEGFGLEVDGRMKAVFPTQEEAQKGAENLKARYPLLQVKVYDAAAHTRPRVQLPTGKATIPIDE